MSKYLYGQLNSSSSTTDYTGATTSTAKVTVDNDNRLIYVDAKINVKEVEEEIAEVMEQYQEILDKYSSFKADIQALKDKDVELDNKIASVSASMSEMDERLTQDIKDAKEELRKDIDAVIVKVQEEIQPKLDSLTLGLKNANLRIDEVEVKITDLDTSLKALINEKITKIESDLAQLKADVQKIIDTEIKGVKEDIAAVQTEVDGLKTSKQDKLVSGTNIKTINGDSLLGSGNIDIQSAIWGNISGDISKQQDLITLIEQASTKEYTDQKFAEAKESIDKKTDHMFYDQFGVIDPDFTEVWYFMAWVDGEEKVVAGPYAMGGGGGGGSITEMTSELKTFPEVVSRSATSCEVVLNWTSLKGTSKVPTGSGTLYVYVDDVLKITQGNVPQGDVTIDILDAIKDSTLSKVTVNFKIVDAYNNYEQKSGTISFVEIGLSSTFDENTLYTSVLHKTGISVDCVPLGSKLLKTMNYYLDDGLIGQIETTESGGQVSFTITKGADGQPLKHGSHKLKVYFTCTIGGKTVSSNVLNFNFMYEIVGETEPMITSSFDESVQQTQYISFAIPYRVYTPGGSGKSQVELSVNGEVIQTLPEVPDLTTQNWEYRPNEYGNFQMVITCGTQHKSFDVVVKEAEIDIKPVTDKLALYLTAIGRSNAESEEKRKKWEYTYKTASGEEETISATLYNFNFQSDGWLQDDDGNTILRVAGDAMVEIPYKPFEHDCKDTGKTIEFEFATSQVMDYSTEIISCFYERASQKIGFSVTAQEAMFKSMSTEGVSSQYKEEEHIRIAFTVDKKNENRLILMYINGVLCNALQYPSDDSFEQPTPANIVIGSTQATTDVYCIRVYDNNLTMKQIVNNWIADTQSGELKLERYKRNDIFSGDTGEITTDLLPDDLPFMIWDMDPLPQYKGDKRPGNVRYEEPLNSARNFTANNAQYNVQGTSSSVYPVKNIRIKYKQGKDDSGVEWPEKFSWYDDDGNTIKNYGIREDSIQDNYFTYKVDYASSEGVNNVELIRLYNDLCKEFNILNPPQKQDSSIRVGIDGFPIAAFHKDSSGSVTFATKANFNNDKANEAVYGFEGAWDDETKPMEERIWVGDESWEITQNNVKVALFQEAVTSENFSQGFEIRFPDEDGYDKLDKLGPMTAWVVSTNPLAATELPLTEPKQFTYTTRVRSEDGTYSTKTITSPLYTTDSAEYRLTKFKSELKDWFNIDSTVFYYVFTHLFLLVDSRAKNCFPTYFASREEGDGGDRWFWLPYDMDTALGM